jgi:hypothetical protein
MFDRLTPPIEISSRVDERHLREAAASWRARVVLNLGLIAAFVLVSTAAGLWTKLDPGLVHGDEDSYGYWLVGEWLYGRGTFPAFFVELRPFAYPLLLGLRHWAGDVGVFLIQAGFWLVGGNLLFSAVATTTSRVSVAWASAALYALVMTNIGITFHGLTEAQTLCLLAVFVWTCSRGYLRGTLGQRAVQVGLASLLTVTRPSFQLFLIVMVAVQLAWTVTAARAQGTHRDRLLFAARAVLVMALALSPVLVQLGITATSLGRPVISNTGSLNALNFLASTYAEVNGLNKDPTREEIQQRYPTRQAMFDWVRQPGHLVTALRLWWGRLVFDNLGAPSSYLGSGATTTTHQWIGNKLRHLSQAYNQIVIALHLLGLIVIIRLWRRGQLANGLETALLLALLYSILLTSGTVRWQGDRIIAVMAPVWIYLYAGLAVRVTDPSELTRRIRRLVLHR